jgi:hypothetical protein
MGPPTFLPTLPSLIYVYIHIYIHIHH